MWNKKHAHHHVEGFSTISKSKEGNSSFESLRGLCDLVTSKQINIPTFILICRFDFIPLGQVQIALVGYHKFKLIIGGS